MNNNELQIPTTWRNLNIQYDALFSNLKTSKARECLSIHLHIIKPFFKNCKKIIKQHLF